MGRVRGRGRDGERRKGEGRSESGQARILESEGDQVAMGPSF